MLHMLTGLCRPSESLLSCSSLWSSSLDSDFSSLDSSELFISFPVSWRSPPMTCSDSSMAPKGFLSSCSLRSFCWLIFSCLSLRLFSLRSCLAFSLFSFLSCLDKTFFLFSNPLCSFFLSLMYLCLKSSIFVWSIRMVSVRATSFSPLNFAFFLTSTIFSSRKTDFNAVLNSSTTTLVQISAKFSQLCDMFSRISMLFLAISNSDWSKISFSYFE
mmetsp:Transcript_16012/g.18602  ORF Transcript_16012/g.18602 Transcript_16012/m.18602 type:complete len:215 (-) Transcript_16012:780-1424(-)